MENEFVSLDTHTQIERERDTRVHKSCELLHTQFGRVVFFFLNLDSIQWGQTGNFPVLIKQLNEDSSERIREKIKLSSEPSTVYVF